MTKKLQVQLDDNLVDELKIYAIRHKKAVKDIVAEAIAAIIGQEIPTEPKQETKLQPKQKTEPPKPQPKQEKPKQKQTEYYLLRKTASVGEKLKEKTVFTDGVIEWEVLPGMYPHYDADGNPIPFRSTNPYGDTFEPFPDEIEEIEKAYGKKVKKEL